MLEGIEKLRKSSHLDDNKWTLENGEIVTVFYADPKDQNAVNWGEQWRNLADEIEREHEQRVAELKDAIYERDVHIGSYESRNTELNDALKVICKSFGVSTEWSAEDAARKVLEALESQYMELPTDADGVPIHMGDIVEGELLDDSTVKGTVCAFNFYDNEPAWVYVKVNVQEGWTIKKLSIATCRHVKEPTIEDILEEFIAAYDVWDDGYTLHCNREELRAKLFEKYTNKLRDIFKDEECSPEETETITCHHGDEAITVHVMECDRCGGEYEHVNGDYEYCPRCRAKVTKTHNNSFYDSLKFCRHFERKGSNDE